MPSRKDKRYPNITWSCLWLDSANHSQANLSVQASQWTNINGHTSVITCPVNSGAPSTLLNLTATYEGRKLKTAAFAHFGNVRVCDQPISPKPMSSVLCAGVLRSGINHKSGVAYTSSFMDTYLLTWIEYNLQIGFDMIMIYFEDEDMEPIKQLLRRYTDTGRVLVIPSFWKYISNTGLWSPMQPAQENHCLYRAKGIARWVGNDDIDEFIDIQGRYKDVNDFMERTVNGTSFVAVAVPENRWPLAYGVKANSQSHQCQEICSGHFHVGMRGRSKWLLDADRVFGYQVHDLQIPKETQTNVKLGDFRTEVRLVHLRWQNLESQTVPNHCDDPFPSLDMKRSSFAAFLNRTCPAKLNGSVAGMFWPRRRWVATRKRSGQRR